jgi:hypothetical protein
LILRLAALVWTHPANRGHRMLAAAKAALWQLRKRVMKSPIDLPFHGLTIRCYPDSHDASRVIYFNGLPDPTEMTFAKHYLRPGVT